MTDGELIIGMLVAAALLAAVTARDWAGIRGPGGKPLGKIIDGNDYRSRAREIIAYLTAHSSDGGTA